MTKESEYKTQSFDWLGSFKQTHDLAKIPENRRSDFADFLSQRAGVRSYYEAIPEEKYQEGIGSGDTLKQEIVHQIGHTRLRIEGLITGKISSFRYPEVHPQEHQALLGLSKDELMREFDATSSYLYDSFSHPQTQANTIKMPYDKTTTAEELLRQMTRHEILHLGMAIKFGDQFNVPRPVAVKKLWG